MKQRIFMYLFIFSVLLIIFQYVNSKNIIENYDKQVTTLKEREIQQKDSIIALEDENFDLKRFSLDYNGDAYNYYEDKGYDTEKIKQLVTDLLYDSNMYEGDDHPIVPYASMTDKNIQIDYIKFLNHKWIIAHFSDGKMDGEILLQYQVENGTEVTFNLLDYVMYMPN